MSDWISVKDRTPESDEFALLPVLGYSEFTGVVEKVFFNTKINAFISTSFEKHYGIIYWQPLPEPPQDKENNNKYGRYY